MKVYIKRIYNQFGEETGAILSAEFPTQTTLHQKYIIETRLIDYAFTILYPGQGLNIFKDMYIDTPSVTIIRNINTLTQEDITL